MFKKTLTILVFLFVSLQVKTQIVTVLQEMGRMPLAGVKVFATNSDDTLETNSDGEVNLDIFSENAVIFFYYPYFKPVKTTKKELAEKENILILEQTDYLAQQIRSKLTVKEYSEDLPIFTEIINLGEDAFLDLENQNVSNKIMVKENNGGVTIFRGLEPKKTMLAMDGMRLNNAIYRNGKIETSLNFDNTLTNRIQQIYAPGFLFYSPDALGGVIQYFTNIPEISGYYPFSGKVLLASKYESASNSLISNASVWLSGYKIASFTSFTFGKFGEITMGKNRKYVPPDDPDYGLNLFYVSQINGRDTMLPNPDPYKQLGTDYTQKYFLQKFIYKANENLNVLFNVHYTTTSDVGIYSGLTEINGDHLRFAECKFMPQDKFITQLNFIYKKRTPFSSLASLNIYSIYFDEYRLTRKYQNPVALHQIEQLYKYAVNLDIIKIFEINRIVYGLEFAYNKINSRAFFQNIFTGETRQGLTRYPTNGSYSQNFAAYFNFKIMQNAQFIVNTTLRYDFYRAYASFSNEAPQLPLSFNQVSYIIGYPTASITFDAYPFSWLQLRLITSATRHVPIIDDFGKVMVKDFVVTIPTDNLKDEKDYNAEFGINIYNEDKFKLYGSVFYTQIYDAIILKDTTLNEDDSLFFGIDRYEIATNVNAPKAYIYGYSSGMSAKYDFWDNDAFYVKLNASFNYIKGWNVSDSTYLPGIPPYFGNVSFLLKYKKLKVKLWSVFNGRKPYEELSPIGEDYIEKASKEGFLPWQVYNVKISYSGKNFEPSFAVYNIFDLFYKVYGTAIASPGRNFVFSLKYNFNFHRP